MLIMSLILYPLYNPPTVLCLVTQSCLTLCDPMDCSLPGSSFHGDSPGKNIGVGFHALLQGIFPTQGLHPGLLHCRRFFTVWAIREAHSTGVAYPFSRGSPWPTNRTGVSCIAGRFFTSWAHCRQILYQLSSLQADSVPAELPGKPNLPTWIVKN